MLSKLALRNAKRSFKDYLIYLITVSLAFSFIFSFNFIIFSKDILELSSAMANMKTAISFVSVIVIFVIGWLIHYTTKFMLEKRSMEFGTYLLLGIEKKNITKMFLLENLFLGFLSFLLSFVLGFFLSQIMTMVIMYIFSVPYQVHITLGGKAILLTLFYFALIYLFVLFRMRCKIRKMKLADLFSYSKKNEQKLYQKKKSRLLLFTFSIITSISAFVLFQSVMTKMMQNTEGQLGGLLVLLSFVLLIFSIYGLSATLPDFLTNHFLKNKKFKYQKDHLFVLRQFTSKMRTMSFTMGTLSLLIVTTLLALNISNVFAAVFQNQTESVAPYDIMIYNLYSEVDPQIGLDKMRDKEEYLAFIREKYTILDNYTYRVYSNDQTPVRKYISDGLLGYQDVDCYLFESDYNKLVKMRGMKPIKLKEGEYFIHSYRDVSKEIRTFLKTHNSIEVNGHKLKNQGMTDYQYTSSWSKGSSYIIVLPDSLRDESFQVMNEVTVVDTKEETSEAFAKEIANLLPPKVVVERLEGYDVMYSFQQITVKGQVENENRSMLTILSFSLMYLAFIFIAVVGTVLSIQSLSDSTKYKYRYQTLGKLGMKEVEIFQTLRKQLLIFFLFPLVYPIIINFLSLPTLMMIFNPFMVSDFSIVGYIFLNLGLFLLVYLIYFFATYYGFKRNIRD